MPTPSRPAEIGAIEESLARILRDAASLPAAVAINVLAEAAKHLEDAERRIRRARAA